MLPFVQAKAGGAEEEEEEGEFDVESYLLEGAPDDYVCPICFKLMTDPVNAGDGHTYEVSK